MLEILDYTNSGFGLMVKRSDFWKTERCQNKNGQLGIIVDKKFYQDEKGSVICWPVIHWEGEVSDSTTHPVNVKPYRAHKLPTIEMYE